MVERGLTLLASDQYWSCDRHGSVRLINFVGVRTQLSKDHRAKLLSTRQRTNAGIAIVAPRKAGEARLRDEGMSLANSGLPVLM